MTLVENKTEQERIVEQCLLALATLGGMLTAEEDIIFRGKQFILPESSTTDEAINFLIEKRNEDERPMEFNRTYLYRPHDGARATLNALKKAFGMVTQRQGFIETMFGRQATPPELITINVGPGKTEQVPWGGLGFAHLPGLTLYLQQTKHAEFGRVFKLYAEGPRKYRFHVEGIFALVEKELEENSLYRGKAFDGQPDPAFLDLSGVNPEKVIYSDETTTQLEANIWSLLRYPEQMAELGVPLKRAVLLEGPYGTGKTLAAYLTAQVAVESGWSFLLCRPGRDEFKDVMATARLYQPAVVFFEDVDVVTDVDSDNVRELLDIFDGVQAKGTRIIVALTTNHVEKIHKAMVRPGRLDAVIHVGELDASGITRLILATVPSDMLSPDIRWTEVTDAMKDFLPAFCRESIDRTVRYNVARNKGQATMLETEDFVEAALGLRPQLVLMEGARDESVKDPLSVALARIVTDNINRTFVDQDEKGRTILQVEKEG